MFTLHGCIRHSTTHVNHANHIYYLQHEPLVVSSLVRLICISAAEYSQRIFKHVIYESENTSASHHQPSSQRAYNINIRCWLRFAQRNKPTKPECKLLVGHFGLATMWPWWWRTRWESRRMPLIRLLRSAGHIVLAAVAASEQHCCLPVNGVERVTVLQL